MNATALIAEDEPVLAQALGTLLGRLWPGLRLLPVAEDGDQAVALALAELPDVLFLDIQMPARDGLDAAETIVDAWPEQRPLPLLVFVTAYDEYALAAFDRAAVDYVLKPAQSARLRETCERLQAQLALRGTHTITSASAGGDGDGEAGAGTTSSSAPESDTILPATLQALRKSIPAGLRNIDECALPPLSIIQVAAGNSLLMVPVEEVLYFEAADKYVRLITPGRDEAQPELLIRTPLRELMPRLDPSQFWQVHRSAVVNVKAIERVSRVNGRLRLHVRRRSETLEVSRMYAHLFKAM